MLRATFPRGRLLDFFTGFRREMYHEGLHFNQDGQTLRAARALSALQRWMP